MAVQIRLRPLLVLFTVIAFSGVLQCVDAFSLHLLVETGSRITVSAAELLKNVTSRGVRARRRQAAIAQLGERQTEDLEVPGSIPGHGNFSIGPHRQQGR